MLPGWVLTVGLASWVIIGVAGVLWLFAWFMGVSATVTIPLIVAMVIGMVAYPLCEKLMARGLGKSAAAGVVLLLLFVIVGVVIWITVNGIVAQWPAIQEQVQAGLDALAATLDSFGINATAVRDALTAAKDAGAAPSGDALGSLGSALTAGISSAFGFLFAVFIGTTLLFYVLSDFPTISNYLGRHMGGLPVAVGEGIVEDAVGAMRGYFRGTTITGAVVATGDRLVDAAAGGAAGCDRRAGHLHDLLHPVLRGDHLGRIRVPRRARHERAAHRDRSCS